MSNNHHPTSQIYSMPKFFRAPQIGRILIQSEDQNMSVITAYFHPSKKQKAVLSGKLEYSFSAPKFIMFG